MEHFMDTSSKIKLFCFPYAGGSAAAFNRWKKYFNPEIELMPMELSGRGRRIKEPFYSSVKHCADDMFNILKSGTGNCEYALYGHSMGTLIIYELMKRIQSTGFKKPLHIFLSGRYPPHIKKSKGIHNLSDPDFLDEILKLGGTPKDLSENRELMGIFIPILKSDYKIVEEYEFVEDDNKWDIDITVMTGLEDDGVNLEDIRQWEQYTSKDFKLYTYHGDHFFIHTKFEDIVSIINKTLQGG
jgi:surfactin synthase thioesterase subunit